MADVRGITGCKYNMGWDEWVETAYWADDLHLSVQTFTVDSNDGVACEYCGTREEEHVTIDEEKICPVKEFSDE